MKSREKFLIAGGSALLLLAIPVLGFLPSFLFERAVRRSIHEQQLLLEGATPLFDTVIVQRLKVGDTLDHAKKVFTDAGQEANVEDDYPSGRKLSSTCRVGRGAAFIIDLHLDSQDRVAKIDITKAYSGP